MTSSTFLSRFKPRAFGRIAIALVLAFLVGPAAVFAEAAEAVMEGKVMDQTGATVSGVKVVLVGATTKQVTTDKEGKFKISVPEGSYVLTAEKPGFVQYRKRFG